MLFPLREKTMTKINAELLQELETLQDPELLLATLCRLFGDRVALGNSGQLSESVLMAMAAQAGFKLRSYTTDTFRLFQETYQLFEALEEKYGVSVERMMPDPDDLAEMVSKHGEFLFFDSKEKQELCCRIRKVDPNGRALETLDVWITGLRMDQSPGRTAFPRLEMIQHKGRPILKVSPLMDWTEEKTWEYAKRYDVPVNELLKKKLPGGWYYESLGCVICTTPIGPHEPRRAGRWRWFNQGDTKKECGLHGKPGHSSKG
jgi:phosphoadenylyl-sulfate reductase (thioredoxin)